MPVPYALRRGLLAVLLLALLPMLALFAPASAQPGPTAPTGATSTLPTAPIPTAPAATPQPALTPEPAAGELVGAQEPIDWVERALRYGPLGLIVLALLALLIWMARSYFVGYGKELESHGQQHAKRAIGAFGRVVGGEQKSEVNAYLDWLHEELQHLPIIPIKSSERQERLRLEDVYVPLRVIERAQIEGFRKLTLGDFDPEGEYRLREEALEALQGSQGVYRMLSDADRLPPLVDERERRAARQPAVREVTTKRLLLVGDAGSGKTTTLHFGALALAHDRQRNARDAARESLDLHYADKEPLLPIYIRLTLLATYVREAQQRAEANDLPALQGAPGALLLKWLDTYTVAQVNKQGPSIPPDLLSRRIAAGGCLVLLDGLDETGDTRERDYMQRLIANLVQDYPQNRYLVASRPFGGLHLPGFEERHLSPMNSDELQRLLRNWFRAVGKTQTAQRAIESAEEQVAYLWGILQGNARLFEMATNPLLLTSMALLVHTGVGLPRERAELYNRLIDLLLDTWRIAQITGGLPGRAAGHSSRYGEEESGKSVQRRLQELAAWMQEQQRREIRLHEAQQVLRPVYQELKRWPAEQCDDYVVGLLESLALESGLLQRRDGGYSFAHYTLQEYLTARAYDQRPDGVDRLFAQRAQPRWRETVLLAVGHWATSGDPAYARQLLRRLLDAEEPSALLLAGDALDDADASRVPELAPMHKESVDRLAAMAFAPARCPDPRIRNRAASLLDRLGADDRPAVNLARPEYWARRIEPGPFMMGDDERGDEDEKPAFIYRIRRPYALARFPVTNRQYLAFLTDLERSGRHAEARERWPRSWPGGRYRAGEGNHPVTGVTWTDATAFAAWADRALRDRGVLPPGEQVRLPAEPEWERAAAYPLNIPARTPGAGRREYPWGRWEDPPGTGAGEGDDLLASLLHGELTSTADRGINGGIRANTRESAINGTSVVGIFPHGAAACGAVDMAGNVWEWCSTPYRGYPLPEDREPETLDSYSSARTYVLRGGSWRYNRSLARCASRRHSTPGYWSASGFGSPVCSPQRSLNVFLTFCLFESVKTFVDHLGDETREMGVQGASAPCAPQARSRLLRNR